MTEKNEVLLKKEAYVKGLGLSLSSRSRDSSNKQTPTQCCNCILTTTDYANASARDREGIVLKAEADERARVEDEMKKEAARVAKQVRDPMPSIGGHALCFAALVVLARQLGRARISQYMCQRDYVCHSNVVEEVYRATALPPR